MRPSRRSCATRSARRDSATSRRPPFICRSRTRAPVSRPRDFNEPRRPTRRLSRLVPTLALATTLAIPYAHAAEPDNAGVSIWTQNVTGFRKDSGAAGGYTKKWDLSDLPHYVPKRKLSGTLRFWGNNYLKDGQLAGFWKEGFEKFHPDLKVEYVLPTGAIAVMALACGVADVGMHNKATLTDLLVFEQMFHYPVSEVMVATGSYDVYGWTPPHIIVVNKDNPP